MRVVIAPDSFKGTATATEAAAALATGWQSVRPHDDVLLRPMADGGEGTMTAIAAATPGARIHPVPNRTGPNGDPVDGAYATLPDGTVVVELAVVSGLPLATAPLTPLTTTSRGTGEIIAAALAGGARRLIVALGGSASTDGGAGLLAALGLRVLDATGTPLPDGGGALTRAVTLDRAALLPAPAGGVVLLTDVTNPLVGPHGAAAVYGPQKGAGAREIAVLEEALTRWAYLLGGKPSAPGAGAAGGVAYGLSAAWGARVLPGARAIADLLGLEKDLATADLAITGEGRFDPTSLRGKAVGEVVRRAGRAGTPIAVVAGDIATTHPRVNTALSLSALAGTRESARAHAVNWLRVAGAHLATRCLPTPTP